MDWHGLPKVRTLNVGGKRAVPVNERFRSPTYPNRNHYYSLTHNYYLLKPVLFYYIRARHLRALCTVDPHILHLPRAHR